MTSHNEILDFPAGLKGKGMLIWILLFIACCALSAAPATGPLHVSTNNPRYFTDGSGEAIYLTGSHTWPNLIDRGPSDPPPVFDFTGYLRFLQKHNHNFIRLWGRHVTW